MEIAEHIDALRQHGTLLAEAAERAGLDASVPPCPPWQVKDLLRHTGYVHRWAARHLIERPAAVLDGPAEDEILASGPTDPELLSWFQAGHAALVQALAAADPDLTCATFIEAPSPLAFWARRQAHETAIHHADAEIASGAIPDYSVQFAADGLDELITGFGRRRKYQPSAAIDGALLHVVAADTGDEWYVHAHEGRMQPRRKDDEPPVPNDIPSTECTISGPASGLYLYLWNRVDAPRAGVDITGDADLLATWQSSVRVRWG